MSQLLFLAGLGRSGTTALTELFDAHPGIAIGMERYKHVLYEPDGPGLTPGHFSRDRFFDFSDGLTNIRPDVHQRWHDFYAGLEEKWDTAAYVGDKITHLRLPRLWDCLPDARFVCIIRDVRSVAASWEARATNPADTAWSPTRGAQAAVPAWNRSLRQLARATRLKGDQVVLVEYERFFGDADATSARRVLDWLGLEWDPAFDSAFAAAHERYVGSVAIKPRTLSDQDEAYVAEHASDQLWQRLSKRGL